MTDYRTKVVQKVLGHLIILIIGVIFDLATLGRLLEKIDNFIIQYMVTLALTFKMFTVSSKQIYHQFGLNIV